jgi:hypothetical protein
VAPDASFNFEEMIKKASALDCARPLRLLLEPLGGMHDADLMLARSVRDEGMRTPRSSKRKTWMFSGHRMTGRTPPPVLVDTIQ